MGYPLFDTDFTNWMCDLDTQLKRLHGFTTHELAVDGRALLDQYYSGVSIFGAIQSIAQKHVLLQHAH
jgi:hypothetical protein